MNLLVAVGALVGLLPCVDFPVPVEAAGVSQHLAAVLALPLQHCRSHFNKRRF